MAEPVWALVAGGDGPDELRASLQSLTTHRDRTWCAVASGDEAAAVEGLGRAIRIDPWPGRRQALARLQQGLGDRAAGVPVVVVAAGTVLRRRFLARAAALVRRGVGLVLTTSEHEERRGPGRRVPGVRMLTDAVLRPGSGMVLRGDVLASLARRGWFGEADLTVGQIRDVAGKVHMLRRGIRNGGPAATPAAGLSVTVLIPAYNEQGWLGETLRSVARQTRPPDEVIVVDDASSDRTGEVARHYGARVIRTDGRRSKAGAQNAGLQAVRTQAVVMLDADTVLHPEAVERLVGDLEAGNDATTGAVLPQSERGFWARGRVIEYAVGVRLYKRVQHFMGSLVVISGCVAAFRTEVLRDLGGFAERSITEDLDVTWRLHFMGYRVGYATRGLAYPAEPPSWRLFKAQMRRWAGGFFQGLALHRRSLPRRPALAFLVAAATWDIVSPAIVFMVLAAFIATGTLEMRWEILLLWQSIVLGIPLVMAASVVGLRRAVRAIPAYAVVLYLGQYFYLEAFVREIVLRQRGTKWIKGH